MRTRDLVLAIILLGGLSGCAGRDGDGKWPTLAPRAGEMSPLVPRTPLGACPGCGNDMIAAPEAPAPVVLPTAPADVVDRIAGAEKAVTAVEAAYPAQKRTTDAAVAAAAGGGADAVGEAEVQRSRLESIFLPLAVQSRALDGIEDDLAGTAEAEALLTRTAALRARIAALEAIRDGL